MDTKICSELVIEGDSFDFNQVEQILQIKATESWKKGEMLRPGLFRKQTSWSISTKFVNTLAVDESLNVLLDVVEHKADALNLIKSLYDVDIFILIVVEIYNHEKPDLSIRERATKFAGRCNMSICFDWYIY